MVFVSLPTMLGASNAGRPGAERAHTCGRSSGAFANIQVADFAD
jgi:hypothetical protein